MPATAPPARLTGPQIGELAAIVCGLFSKTELLQLVRTRLDPDPLPYVNKDTNDMQVASDLIEFLNRSQRIEELINAAARARPRAAGLSGFRDRVHSGSRPHRPAGSVDTVADALGTAAEAAQADPEVREMIGEGRVTFELTRDELDRLARYKGLHDCLHTLQLQLSAIARAARAFPSDPTAARELTDYARQLRRCAQRARERAEALPTADDEREWVNDFDAALTGVQEAIRAAAGPAVTAAAAALGRLLPEAYRINSQLIGAAIRLSPGLTNLAHTLAALSERLAALGHSRDVAARVRAGSDTLFELSPRLAGLVTAHDGWQWVDNELATAARMPPGRPADRVPRWDRFRRRLARVCPAGAALDPTADPLELTARWEAEADPVEAENLFLGLQAAARLEFKEVDDRLLELADHLALTIAPLDALLQVI